MSLSRRWVSPLELHCWNVFFCSMFHVLDMFFIPCFILLSSLLDIGSRNRILSSSRYLHLDHRLREQQELEKDILILINSFDSDPFTAWRKVILSSRPFSLLKSWLSERIERSKEIEPSQDKVLFIEFHSSYSTDFLKFFVKKKRREERVNFHHHHRLFLPTWIVREKRRNTSESSNFPSKIINWKERYTRKTHRLCNKVDFYSIQESSLLMTIFFSWFTKHPLPSTSHEEEGSSSSVIIRPFLWEKVKSRLRFSLHCLSSTWRVKQFIQTVYEIVKERVHHHQVEIVTLSRQTTTPSFPLELKGLCHFRLEKEWWCLPTSLLSLSIWWNSWRRYNRTAYKIEQFPLFKFLADIYTAGNNKRNTNRKAFPQIERNTKILSLLFSNMWICKLYFSTIPLLDFKSFSIELETFEDKRIHFDV